MRCIRGVWFLHDGYTIRCFDFRHALHTVVLIAAQFMPITRAPKTTAVAENNLLTDGCTLSKKLGSSMRKTPNRATDKCLPGGDT